VRVGLISDVHGNLFALRAVLAALGRAGTETILCAGDLVGYGPHPNECVEAIAELGIRCVTGNHDLMAVGRLSDRECVRLARDSQRWTQDVLTPPTRAFLEALPARLEAGPIVVAHGSLDDPREYIVSETHAAGQLHGLAVAYPASRLLVLGHTHRQWVYAAGYHTLRVPHGGRLPLAATRHLLNPGSVGQSRQWERTPRARFMVLDLDCWLVECHAIGYDVSASRQALRRAGFGRAALHSPPGPKRAYWRARSFVRDTTGGGRRGVG